MSDGTSSIFHQALDRVGKIGSDFLGELSQLVESLASQIPVGPSCGQEHALQKEVAVERTAPLDTPCCVGHRLGNLLRGLEITCEHCQEERKEHQELDLP